MLPILDFRDHLDPRRVAELAGTTREAVLDELLALLGGHPHVRDLDAFRTAVLERERLVSTGIGLGVAVPHAKVDSVSDYVVAVGRSRVPVEFEALDREPVRLFFLLGAAEHQSGSFVRLLASVVRTIRSDPHRERLLTAGFPDPFLAALRERLP